MKLLLYCLSICLLLVLGACAPTRTTAPPPPPEPAVLEIEPPPAVETAESAPLEPSASPSPEPAPSDAVTAGEEKTPTTATDSIPEKHLEQVQDQKILLQVLRDAGVPDDNLTPGRKEQIAVYQREGKYEFYHFRNSQLIAVGEYPRSTIEQMQQQGSYPADVIRDFAQLPQ